MRYEIVTGNDIALDFTPTVVVGFFQAGKEDIFMQNYTVLKKHFPQAEVIGISSESNIVNTVPFVDTEGKHQCVFMMLAMNKEAFSIQILSQYEALQTDDDKVYAAVMLGTEDNDGIENAVSYFQKKIGSHNLYGAIAGHALDTDEKGSLFYNGNFIESGYLIWLIDSAYYTLKGMSIHNFEPVWVELSITDAKAKTILEIEDEPALNMIEEVMGMLMPEGLNSYDHPFFIWSEEKNKGCDDLRPLTTLRSIDRKSKSLEFFKNVHSGDKLKIAIPVDRMEQEKMLNKLIASVDKNSASFLFASTAFKGHWAEMEPLYLMHLSEMTGLKFVGFHTFGEIGPLAPECTSMLQNQTLTLITLNETAK